jgi:hypothetical protein
VIHGADELRTWDLQKSAESRADNGDVDTDQTQHTCSPLRVKNFSSSKSYCMNARNKRRRRRRKNKNSRYSSQ